MHIACALAACTGISLIAACPAETRAPVFAGRYVGFWEFELHDSTLAVTITCVATLQLRAADRPRAVIGDLSLEACAAEPAGLVTIAARTPLTGAAEWQPAQALEVGYWRLGLRLRNSTGSIGELLGCVPESVPWQQHFLADVRIDTDPIIMLGTLATSDQFTLRCGRYHFSAAATLALERS